MRFRNVLFTAFFLASASGAGAGTIDAPYSIGTWHGFRHTAVSYTFDDNTPDHFQTVLPMFNEFGFPVTLFTVTDWVRDWNELRSASAQGHEVASHSVTHPNFGNIGKSQQIAEIENSRIVIQTQIPDKKCVTHAYPYCVTGNDSAMRANYIAGRICSGSNESSNPANMMWLSSIVTGDQGSIRTTANFNSRMKGAVRGKQWIVWLTHCVDGTGWSPTSPSEIRGSLEYLHTRQDTFWVATFGAVARYILERKAVDVHETAAGDTGITVQVTDTLDNAVFDHPVTLRRPLPEGWPFAVACQAGLPIASSVIEVDGAKAIQFDAVPDAGEVVISRRESAAVGIRANPAMPMPRSYQNYPNPFNPATTIEFSLPRSGKAELTLVDATGRTVARLADGFYEAGTHR
ncbi:polysaccharide deacetylase family protein, partial [bacterium]|nr:polysaccharide deacetylase family protein [bacterium]